MLTYDGNSAILRNTTHRPPHTTEVPHIFTHIVALRSLDHNVHCPRVALRRSNRTHTQFSRSTAPPSHQHSTTQRKRTVSVAYWCGVDVLFGGVLVSFYFPRCGGVFFAYIPLPHEVAPPEQVRVQVCMRCSYHCHCYQRDRSCVVCVRVVAAV